MNEEVKTKEVEWGKHWLVMSIVIIASVLNWWIGHLVFTKVSICGIEWLDTVGTYLCALWWVFAFIVWGYWPFTRIKNLLSRGIILLGSAWFLGVLSWYAASKIVDLGTYGFPIIANFFFWIVMTDFAFHLWSKLPSPKKAVLDLLLWCSLVILTMIILPNPGQIPAWWFVPTQWLLGMGIIAYWTKDMNEFGAGITFWVINVVVVALIIVFASLVSQFTFSLSNTYSTLLGGNSLYFLIWFGAGCSFNWGIFVIFEGLPWRKIKPPTLGAIMGLISVLIIQVIVALVCIAITKAIWPPTGPDDTYYLFQAFVLAYVGVNWSFAIPLAFPSKETGFPPTWSWESKS